ncbi:hypothetical protein GobsT_44020 [Gemmata obscuriglobus]|uniref:DUF4274 domain-containing protein n=1 Tax=Gemmata obscuriglobus TaxID=114 RepID=A0A2Z3GW96_9BACT|nr:hypothetical protein [Gemmata obscuriglobus]AWM37608.1 hypothetical protein C1280_11755 [Gemmata obscuriglobus]QEG29604.1 hypothetical protein GobsT_44020 [Gemmata obscuriglobus]VTS08889.1 : DUF4274 [Gemmata obscuriglobus UQM 2246]
MTLSPEQRKRVAWLKDGHLDDEDEGTFDARWWRQFAALASPEELFLHASECHPAQGVAEWRRLLDHRLCDQGTALLIFWRNSPVHEYGSEPAGGWDRERHELVREIAGRCAAGAYPSALVRFDPAAFKGFSFLAGYTPEELERVPAHMRVPSPGQPVAPLTAPDFEWGEGLGAQ